MEDENAIITTEPKKTIDKAKLFSYFILFLLICLSLLAGYCLYLETNKANIINDCNEFWQKQFEKKCGGNLYDETFELTPGMADIRAVSTD